tara:strand:- start:559 stop:771 length:213 start_codon:yes stop_codon:yes gene_type:complete
MDPREAAELEAKKTFDQFILWTKRTCLAFGLFGAVVVFGCNSGVETGPKATGSKYDGESYSPMNLNVKEK